MGTIKRRRVGAQAWRVLLRRFAGSGLPVQAFCRRESISAASFYRWRERLGSQSRSRAATPTPPAEVVAERGPAEFVDLGTLGAGLGPSGRFDLKVDLGGGLVLHLVRG